MEFTLAMALIIIVKYLVNSMHIHTHTLKGSHVRCAGNKLQPKLCIAPTYFISRTEEDEKEKNNKNMPNILYLCAMSLFFFSCHCIFLLFTFVYCCVFQIRNFKWHTSLWLSSRSFCCCAVVILDKLLLLLFC